MVLSFLSDGGRQVRPWYRGHWVEVGSLALKIVKYIRYLMVCTYWRCGSLQLLVMEEHAAVLYSGQPV